MTGSRVLIGVASVLAGTAVLFAVFGLVYNPILIVAAVPFGVASYFLWGHATGRLEARMRRRVRTRPAGDPTRGPNGQHDRVGGARRVGPGAGPRRRGSASSSRGTRPDAGPTLSRPAAARVLGIDVDADQATVRRAFRERAKEHHPDAPDGDEAAFRRARAAYETLRNGQ